MNEERKDRKGQAVRCQRPKENIRIKAAKMDSWAITILMDTMLPYLHHLMKEMCFGINIFKAAYIILKHYHKT